MLSQVLLTLLGLVLYRSFIAYLSLRRNIGMAKATGIPYIVTPISNLGFLWNALGRIVLPPLYKVPWVKDWVWLRMIEPTHCWTFLREYIDKIGDCYLVVSPSGLYFASTNAEVNSQIAARRVDFPKPIKDYRILNLFGDNIVTVEGSDWRRHRRILAPAFNERSNALAWEQSLSQAQGMLKLWARREGNDPEEMKINDTSVDAATLALHVVSGIGFGITQIWPGEDESILGDNMAPGLNTTELTGNHTMTFKESLRRSCAVDIIWFTLVPDWLLRTSPFKMHKDLLRAYDECSQYLKQLFEFKKRQKETELRRGDKQGMTDLIGPLVRASEEAKTKGTNQDQGLNYSEVIGNCFMLTFAGHETSASMIHFSLLFLAINLGSQSRLQADIDAIAVGRPPPTWAYSTDMRLFYNSMVGAVMNETLRLIPPVPAIPKNTFAPQLLTMDGKSTTLPAGTFIHMNVVGTNHNPKYYPHQPSKVTSAATDINDFVPERWLLASSSTSTSIGNSKSTETDPNSSSSDNKGEPATTDGLETVSYEQSSIIYKPPKGAFLSFSDGGRACPGRRFAQVEIVAVLAVIFNAYSVELDVSTWATDDDVARMSPAQKRAIYTRAVDRARALIRSSEQIITIRMERGQVPVRFVRRGTERFRDIAV